MTIGETRERVRVLREQVKDLAGSVLAWQQAHVELSLEQRLAYVQGVSAVCRELWEGLDATEELLRRLEDRAGPDFDLKELD